MAPLSGARLYMCIGRGSRCKGKFEEMESLLITTRWFLYWEDFEGFHPW